MKIKLEATDKNIVYDFLTKYVKPIKNPKYKILDYGKYEKDGQEWTFFEADNIDIKIN